MPDLEFAQDRQFPVVDLAADPLVLVVPDDMVAAPSVVRVQQTLAGQGGRKPEIVPQKDFDERFFQDVHVIACGNLADNAALRRLYTARCCFVDTFFPGPDGYFIKSISDPFGHNRNCIVVGASSCRDLDQALEVFAAIAERSQGVLKRVHAHRFAHQLPPLPDESQLQEMVQEELDIWGGGWSASPFRGGQLQNYMWHYYLTDHPVWGRAIPPIFAGSLAPWRTERQEQPQDYHCFFNLHSLIHLWDLIEDSPLYSQEERRSVVTMFGELLHHLAGLFYLTEEVNPPGLPRQNHSTFIALNLEVGHDYMRKRWGIREFASAIEAVERIFSGQAGSYKPNDDAGVGYAWHVPQETLFYLLYRNDYRYIDQGHVADLCRLAVLTTDNMRSEASYGDVSGYAGFSPNSWDTHLWPLMVSTWRQRDPEHLWMLNWLGQGKKPPLDQVLSGLYAAVEFEEEGFSLEGCQPREPVDLLGISSMPLPEPVLRLVQQQAPATHHPDPHKYYFDKLSLRPGFDPGDEYLLLEGVGTLCHGHEDSNAIIRLCWNQRAWLADGDYIRAAPRFHNSIAISRDGAGVLESPGDGVVIPPLAALNHVGEGPEFGLVQSEVAGYNGMDWRRHIFWLKGRFIAVMDQLRCTVPGTYACRCLWRLVGEVEQQADQTRLHQQGENFFIHHAGAVDQEVVPDLHEAGYWNGYPYADPVPQVLHQKSNCSLQSGEDLGFVNLFTPHQDIQVERLDELVVRVVDKERQIILGAGPARLDGVEIEGATWVLCLSGDALQVQGVERLSFESHTEQLNGALHSLDASGSALARTLCNAVSTASPQPLPPSPSSSPPRPGGLQTSWSRAFPHTEISAVEVRGNTALAATRDGQVAQLALDDGKVSWSQKLEAPASALRLADIDRDGVVEVLVGTTDSELLILEGQGGAQRWRRGLKNMSGRGERVVEIVVADLDGSGQPDILAGTAGWYVNAFKADGESLWASWIRYHIITALAVEDADGDGRAEVMVGNVYSTPLSVHNFDGSFRWSTLEQVGAEGNATTPRRGIGLSRLQLGDVDGDGIREIVYGTEDGWIYVVKPQDGAEVWHANIVGAVKGLVATPWGLFAASEYGDLYGFSHQGRMRWKESVSEWTRDLALVGDQLVAAAENGLLLRYDLRGRCTGSASLEGEICGLWACDRGVLCSHEGGRLSCVEI